MAGARPRPGEGPGLTWRQLDPHQCSGSWNGKFHGTITAEADGWLAYLRLEDPPGLSPITTVGRYDTVEEAQVATDEVWASRCHSGGGAGSGGLIAPWFKVDGRFLCAHHPLGRRRRDNWLLPGEPPTDAPPRRRHDVIHLVVAAPRARARPAHRGRRHRCVEVISGRRCRATHGLDHGRVQQYLATPSNGHFVIADLGGVDGVLGIACTGAFPRTGTMIPGQVVTQLGLSDTQLRIMRNDGLAITGTVRINCVIEFGSIAEGQAAADRLGVAANAG
jgi:hypothetical protein